MAERVLPNSWRETINRSWRMRWPASWLLEVWLPKWDQLRWRRRGEKCWWRQWRRRDWKFSAGTLGRWEIKPAGMMEWRDATSDEQTSTDTVWYNLERDSNGSSLNHEPQATSQWTMRDPIRSHQMHWKNKHGTGESVLIYSIYIYTYIIIFIATRNVGYTWVHCIYTYSLLLNSWGKIQIITTLSDNCFTRVDTNSYLGSVSKIRNPRTGNAFKSSPPSVEADPCGTHLRVSNLLRRFDWLWRFFRLSHLQQGVSTKARRSVVRDGIRRSAHEIAMFLSHKMVPYSLFWVCGWT